jgi:signal transduction histidine kinase
MISALDDMGSIVRCIEMGAEDYLAKPFDATLLRARIGASLEKKRLRDRERALFQQVQTNYRQLQQLERLRDDLTHMIVHDLRTPLTSFLSGLQTLGLIGDLNAVQEEILTGAVMGGQTLLGMINDLLDISKMESHSLVLEFDTLTASVLVQHAVRQVGSLAAEKNQTLHVEDLSYLPSFEGDEEKLLRTLVNLLSNAIKFTPIGGVITISAGLTEDGEALLFRVRDTGEGIPQEALERIFDKFGQVETRQAGRKMSTGLGLTFCKLAIEAHGGSIRVESTLGQGSTFSFSIPRKR